MATTSVLAEIVIIGITANLGILFAVVGFSSSTPSPTISSIIKDTTALIILLMIGFSYFSGNLINVFSHIVFDKLDKRIRREVLNDKPYQSIRLKVYKISGELKSFLDVRYSILRLFRSSVISFVILGIGFIIWRPSFLSSAQFYFSASLLFALAVLSFFAFWNQTKVFYKIIKNLEPVIDTKD